MSSREDRLPRLCPAPKRSCSPQTGVIACSHYGSGRNPFEEDRLANMALDMELSTLRQSLRISPRNNAETTRKQARQFIKSDDSTSPPCHSGIVTLLGGGGGGVVVSPRSDLPAHRRSTGEEERSPVAVVAPPPPILTGSPRGVHRRISPTNGGSPQLSVDRIQQEYDAFYSARPPLAAILEQRRKVKAVEDTAPPAPPPPNRVEALKMAITRFEEGPQCVADALEFSVSLRSINQNFTYPT